MKKNLILSAAIVIMLLFAVSCTGGSASSTNVFASKLAELSKAQNAFENVLSAAATLEDAKASPEYGNMMKLLSELNTMKNDSKVTDSEKLRLGTLEKLINAVLNQ